MLAAKRFPHALEVPANDCNQTMAVPVGIY
jgi:hypothetical protein